MNLQFDSQAKNGLLKIGELRKGSSGMAPKYRPKDHIQRLEVPPRAEGVLDQREVTIQSYQTTIPFNYDELNAGLESAWLTPQIRFGVFSRTPLNSESKYDLTVVLGLQDKLSVRAYDYDHRRPLWFSWQNLVVETINVNYFRDENGLLRFTTTGGGRRVSGDCLNDFNASFLQIPQNTVSKRCFDLTKLRELCFGRFMERLYMLRFSDPSGKEYRSIDHALFQSRKYIAPDAERLLEISADEEVKIESFDSDVEVEAEELSSPVQVRFFLRGQSGSLRLRFPKMRYEHDPATPAEQARVFYRLVNITVSSILDSDYYARERRTLDDLDADLGMFPEMVDLAPFREALIGEEERSRFFERMDLNATWSKWNPHLRALDELVVSDNVKNHVAELVSTLSKGSPQTAANLLLVCKDDPQMNRIGAITADVISKEVHQIPAEVRAQVEESLLAWAVAHELDTWDIDLESGEIEVFTLRWKTEDLSVNILPAILWKILGLLHDRLLAANSDKEALLRKFNQCVIFVKSLPPNHLDLLPALRLIAEQRVPVSISEGNKILKNPVSDFCALDDAILSQFGLPQWPCLSAIANIAKVTLMNCGIGAAIAVRAKSAGTLFDDEAAEASDLAAGESIDLTREDVPSQIEVHFEKFGREHRIILPVMQQDSAEGCPESNVPDFDWAIQAELERATCQVLGESDAPSKSKISRAVTSGKIESNGESGRKRRVNVDSFSAWMAKDSRLSREEVTQIRNAIIGEIRARKK